MTVLKGWFIDTNRHDTALMAQLVLRGSGIPCRADTRKSVFDPLNKLKIYVRACDFERAKLLLHSLLLEVRIDPREGQP